MGIVQPKSQSEKPMAQQTPKEMAEAVLGLPIIWSYRMAA
jgi:hypothetical protein